MYYDVNDLTELIVNESTLVYLLDSLKLKGKGRVILETEDGGAIRLVLQTDTDSQDD